jgi:hypothetical protein
LAGIRILGNDQSRVACLHFRRNFWKFASATGVTKKLVDIFNTHAGHHALIADMPIFLDEVLKERDLKFVAGAEIAMAALACPHAIFLALNVPIQPAFPQTGPWRNYTAVALRLGGAFLNDCKIARAELADSVSVGFEIVEDAHLRNRKLFLDLAGIHSPREVCRLGAALFHWARHAKARSEDLTFLIL